MSLRSFEDLECWKAGRDLRMFVARVVVPNLPIAERFRLSDQILRSARSVTANLAEGFGRYHFADNSKFCRNALGSCCETMDHLITARDEGMLSLERFAEGQNKANAAHGMISGYIAYLQRAARQNGGT
jgi:four helix bundle protein